MVEQKLTHQVGSTLHGQEHGRVEICLQVVAIPVYCSLYHLSPGLIMQMSWKVATSWEPGLVVPT